MPAILPLARVRRMQKTDIGPTGAATERPITNPPSSMVVSTAGRLPPGERRVARVADHDVPGIEICELLLDIPPWLVRSRR